MNLNFGLENKILIQYKKIKYIEDKWFHLEIGLNNKINNLENEQCLHLIGVKKKLLLILII